MQRQRVDHLDPAPWPQPDRTLQIRSGKIKSLGKEQSAIFKTPLEGLIYVGETGIQGDQHQYASHGGIHRAVHQYAACNYPKWQKEHPDRAHMFQEGAFGENLISSTLDEENVCIGDLFRIGEEPGVILEVSEPRNPCYKLNIRLQWNNALKRIQRTGRVGWNMRVPQPGHIKVGDSMTLIQRPFPRWSVMNVQRVLHGRSVDPGLIEELSEIKQLSPYFLNLAQKRLETASRTYQLSAARMVTTRVRELTFDIVQPLKGTNKDFKTYAYAQLKFGPNNTIARSYSIVSGNLERFTLGVSLDGESRGGSKYLHQMPLGEKIEMGPGQDLEAAENEKWCQGQRIDRHTIIIGGIGVTAFLPVIQIWEREGIPFEVHSAVRSMDQAAYLDRLPANETTVYAKSRGERMNIEDLIPKPGSNEEHRARIFCCGPSRMMEACRRRTSELLYPEHLLHFESFGTASGYLGEPFDVYVEDVEAGRQAKLTVPSDKSLLRVLSDAGFDVMSSCQSGSCSACKITLCSGSVEHKTNTLDEDEKKVAMLSCVDRAAKGSTIKVQVD